MGRGGRWKLGVGGAVLAALIYVSTALGSPTNVTQPFVSGTFAVGDTLSADPGSWLATDPSYSYDWQRCTGYAAAVKADSPNGYWRLGDAVGSATAADSGPNSLTASATGITFGATGALSGDSSTAAAFNGSSYASVPDATALRPGSITLEAWVNTTATTGTIVSKQQTNPPQGG